MAFLLSKTRMALRPSSGGFNRSFSITPKSPPLDESPSLKDMKDEIVSHLALLKDNNDQFRTYEDYANHALKYGKLLWKADQMGLFEKVKREAVKRREASNRMHMGVKDESKLNPKLLHQF